MSTYDRFTTALITGGAGGLGKAIARNFIQHGKKVIIAGRTESKLVEAQKDLGQSCIGYATIDVSDLSSLPDFAKRIVADYPDVDCVVNNAGVQKLLDFKAGNVDAKQLGQEVDINILALVTLCSLFSTHLQSKSQSVIMNISSGLAYVPISPCPVYCATKAFVKSFTLSLRVQLQDTSVKVVEIAPPMVESDLHREHSDPDNNKKSKNEKSLSQDEFISDVEKGLSSGGASVGAGMTIGLISKWQATYGDGWATANNITPDSSAKDATSSSASSSAPAQGKQMKPQ